MDRALASEAGDRGSNPRGDTSKGLRRRFRQSRTRLRRANRPERTKPSRRDGRVCVIIPLMRYQWKVADRTEDDLLRQLLKNRGITGEENIARFLNPDWDRDVISPWTFTRMREATARVFEALEKGEKIVIHGDYDADGTCGATLIYTALRTLALPNVSVFLPDREKDGYGVALHTVERFAQEGVKLLITVDCGIANDVPLDFAHAQGIDVIVCDHHQLGEKLPAHATILHPLAPGETYENKTLCGTGVAFKLACALFEEARKRGRAVPEGSEKWLLDLVAIATVTDVMPLKGENRALEYFGLKVLNKTKRLGLLAMMEYGRTPMGKIDTETIGFQIGPRINAAGRIKSAEVAFRCLSAETTEDASRYAGELERLNRERQKISDVAFSQATDMIALRQTSASVHVVWSELWMPGVVGLVAGKLVSEFGAPAFAFAKVGEHYVGSGRSIGGFHLVEAMRACGDIFLKSGGHPEACGLTVASIEHLQLFQERIDAVGKTHFKDQSIERALMIDGELPPEEATRGFFDQLMGLAPFGQGNPRPVFYAKHLLITAMDVMGSTGSHVRLSVATPWGPKKCVGFGFAKDVAMFAKGDRVDIAYELALNEWNGNEEVQMRLLDIRASVAP